MLAYFRRLCLLDNSAFMDNRNVVCDAGDKLKIVGNEEITQSLCSLQVQEEIRDLSLDRKIKSS